MLEVRIRLARDEDAKPIGDMISGWLKWKIDRVKTFLEALREENHLILVAEAEGRIVGFLHLLFYLDVLHAGINSHILLIYVKEDYRGKSVGKTLLDEAVRHAIKRGAVEMHVDTIFEDAAKFYKNYGFKDDGVMLELSLTNFNKRASRRRASVKKSER